MPSIAESSKLLLEEVGPSPDLTLIRTEGNLGDELIWAGTRRLLRDRIHREIGLEEVAANSGEVAIVIGSGAWGRVYNQFMPELLAIAEMRFSRVIVFPTSFEVSEDRVRTALSGSRATVFARELESFRQISGICRARLALDGAFYYDYEKFRGIKAEGELNAFRTDAERLGAMALPNDNDDISLSADSLEHWLETIARHEAINTDRAHVMIAAALMGRRVKFAPSGYFKVDALAESLQGDYDIGRYEISSNGHVEPAEFNGHRTWSADAATERATARVSVVITGRDESEAVAAALESSPVDDPLARVIVHDRNSLPMTRRVLEGFAARRPGVELRMSDRDSGFPQAFRLVAEESSSEYLMVLGYDMELEDDALDRMVAVLDQHPGVHAVAPVVVDGDRTIQHAGGWLAMDSNSVAVEFAAVDRPLADNASLRAATGWVPSRGTLFRRTALDLVPPAALDDDHAQNIDWCMRAAELGPDALRVCTEAIVVASRPQRQQTLPLFVSRREATSELPSHAKFFERHGRVLGDRLPELVPELIDPRGELNIPAAELLLSLVSARGPEWTLMKWMNGGLDPLFAGVIAGSPSATARQREQLEWLELRHETLIGIENGSWWKLRNRLQPIRRVVVSARGRGKRDDEVSQ